MEPNQPERIVIESVEFDEETKSWRVVLDEQLPGIAAEVRKMHVFPQSVLAHRAAEYGLDPGDVTTLLDIVICEPYLSREWWTGRDHLFAAPTVDEARVRLLAEIVKIKWKYRLVTRGKEHPLNAWRETAMFSVADLAFKAMNVALLRHEHGAEILPPNIIRAFGYLKTALEANPQALTALGQVVVGGVDGA